jgi:cobalamin biosynthesis protein CobD/CbiB
MSIELVAVLILMMYDESMSGEILLVLGVIVTGFVALYFLLKTTLQHNQSPAQLEQVVNQVFGLSASKIAEQSRQLLSSERETIHVDIENKRQAIEELVKDKTG